MINKTVMTLSYYVLCLSLEKQLVMASVENVSMYEYLSNFACRNRNTAACCCCVYIYMVTPYLLHCRPHTTAVFYFSFPLSTMVDIGT